MKVTNKTWPKYKVNSVKPRKRDLVIRIANWLDDINEPSYDVEVYVKGVYDWNESRCFTLFSGLSREQAKQEAIKFAQQKIANLL